MSRQTAEYFDAQERREKRSRLNAVALQIRNDLHLKVVLLSIEAKERRSVYNALKPLLQFRPLNYRRLMRLAPAPIGRVN